MAIEFRCPQCQKLLRTPEGTSGKDARCPQCGATVRIPEMAHARALAETQPGEKASENPYAAPRGAAPAAAAPPDEALVPTRIEIGDVMTRTWEIFKLRWLPCGAAVFGVGWGLCGFCPGPAVASLGTAAQGAFVFVAAMVAGILAARLLALATSPKADPATT